MHKRPSPKLDQVRPVATKKNPNRREFLETFAAVSTISVLPRHVLGGPGFVAPSDKVNLALIGSGTQSLRMLMSSWLPREDVHLACICDPNKDTDDYRDWSPHGIRNNVREFIKNPRWGSEQGIRAGREAGKEIVESYYADIRGVSDYKGCTTYVDFRELLEQEEGIDGVLVMTPEHLHGTISIAAMKKGKHTISHKTLANVLYEVRLAADTARETGVVTHLLAWQNDPAFYQLRDWIQSGIIGPVREVHNWSNRPVWPQGWMENPTEAMNVPKGMEWDLWLGSVPDRSYHLDYTHALFRGWYDFGSGCLGDMGNYSLWRVYRILNPGPLLSVEAHASTGAVMVGHQSQWKRSEVAFPHASTIHFQHKDVDIFWYDGGMKPNIPRELLDDGEELGRQGMLYVGDYGKILGDFHARRFRLIPEKRMASLQASLPQLRNEEEVVSSSDEYMNAIKEGKQSRGSFQEVQELAEATCLGNLALRMGRRLEWDAEQMKVTNVAEANQFLRREYRPGWEL